MIRILSATGLAALLAMVSAPLAPALSQSPGGSTAQSWEGAYAGLNLGATGRGVDINRGGGAGSVSLEQGAVHFGGHVGYNRSLTDWTGVGGLLGGVELDLAHIGGSVRRNDAVLGNVELKSGLLSTLRLRLGYAWEGTYLYGAAGPALSTMTVRQVGSNDRDLRLGVSVGAGAEFRLAEKWTGRVELQGVSLPGGKVRLNGANRNIDGIGAATVRFGITRRF